MIEAWYDEEAEEPVVIETAAELDPVLADIAAVGGPTLVNLHVGGEYPWLEVGLNDNRGTLRYVGDDAPEGAFSRNTEAPFPLPETGEVTYYYLRNERPYPDDAEIPAEVVRRAAHEFVASGGSRPSGVSWTEQASS